MAYSPMSPDVYGMMPSYGGAGAAAGYGAGWGGGWDGSGYGDAYTGAATGVWPRPAKGAGRGRRQQAVEAEEDAGDDDEE